MRNNIRKVLKEVLGVPTGVLESAEKLYDIILNELETGNFSLNKDHKFFSEINLTISDYEISIVNFTLKFHEFDEMDKVEVASMSFQNKSSFSNKDLVLIHVIDEYEISLALNFVGPLDMTTSDLAETFKRDKVNLTAALAHELKHAFDFYKQEKTGVKKISTYSGYQKTSFPSFPPINKFFHFLYFVHAIENLVRPTEFASKMRSGDIDREKFYDFLLNDETYKMLKDISQFSFEEMREDLKTYTKQIKKFLNNIGAETRGLKTDDEIVDYFLKIVYINIVNRSMETVMEILTTNQLERVFGFLGDKEELFNKMVNHFNKFDKNPLKFYYYEEKNFHRVSKIMMKKLSKLYDLAKINQSSILNWDLHHKINKTGEQIETKLKYK